MTQLMERLFVIDATGYIYRSYFAIRGMSNSQGHATNALFGFVRSLNKLIKDFAPQHIVAVFDGPGGAGPRQELYAEYKMNRLATPDDLPPQREWAQEFCEMMGIPLLVVPGVEADDVMGSIATWAEKSGCEVMICSSDKDMVQLIDDKVKVLQTHKDNLVVDIEKTQEIYGIHPSQMIDYLAMVGDSSDNVPGIPGIGPKTASKLLQQYQTLDELLQHPEKAGSPKQQDKFREFAPQAKLSRKLVTIDTRVEIPLEADFYRRRQPEFTSLRDFFSSMDFRSMLTELQEAHPEVAPQPVKSTQEPGVYHLVDDKQALEALLESLSKHKSLCVDTETSSEDPIRAEIVGVGLGVEPGEAWYIPFNGKLGASAALSLLKPFLESTERAYYGQNIKYDYHVLQNHGIRLRNIDFDTMLASYLLSAHSHRHSLDALAKQYFDHEMTPISALIGKGKKQLSMADVALQQVCDYCCEDVDYTCRLRQQLEQELKERKLLDLLNELELPLMKVLAHMERQGIFVDRKVLDDKSKVLREHLDRLAGEIFEIADQEFNLNSPKQVGEVLFEKMHIPPVKKTSTGYSTSAEVLETLAIEHPIARKILDFRAMEKLRSTYIEALPEYINPNTGRIHCSFVQSMAATGRLSSRDPNLQNIPVRTEEGREIRAAFRPEKPNWSFLAADYSQIELRLLAHFSQDPTLQAAFRDGADIHTHTAARMLDIPLDEVTKEQRSQAKAVNFGIIYGQQAFGLSKQLGIPVKTASEFIKRYFERYPKVQAYIEQCKQAAHKSGKAVTMFGRERIIPEINNRNAAVRAQAERLAVNTPLQGSQADLIKKAMLTVEAELLKQQKLAYLVLQIHDELILEVPDHELIDVEHIVRCAMEKVCKLSVPLLVNVSSGKTWRDC